MQSAISIIIPIVNGIFSFTFSIFYIIPFIILVNKDGFHHAGGLRGHAPTLKSIFPIQEQKWLRHAGD